MRANWVALGLGLGLLAACETAPVEPPEMTMPSAAQKAANPWVLDNLDTAAHEPSGGSCPAMIGTFRRSEYSVLPVQDSQGYPRYDGICQYKNDEIAGFITVYFYAIGNQTLIDEMTSTLSSIRSRNDVTFMPVESETCSNAMKNSSDGGGCAVLDFAEMTGRTYAALAASKDWFSKIRATIRRPSQTNYDLAQAAIIDFYNRQP